jgi:acyl-coenzyme A thioesterase PaaI-like protein
MTDLPAGIPKNATVVATDGFCAFAGPIYRLADVGENGAKRFAFVPAAHHLNESGEVAGAMLTALMEIAMTCAAQLDCGAQSVRPTSLSCDFVAAAMPGDVIEVQVRIVRRTRTIVFMSADLVSAGPALMVGNGVWKILDVG